MVERLDVRFPVGGDECSAWMYLPERSGTPPVVVLGHGLGGIREMRLDAYAERFCAAGYACLVFDYRHFGASDGHPRQLLDIDRQLQDWTGAIQYARSCDALVGGKVILWGTSFGGGHVLIAAARDQNIAAVVSQCPFTSGLASALAMSPRSSMKVTARAMRDVLGAQLKEAPTMVATFGPPGSASLLTAPDAAPGYRALVPDGAPFRNEVAARFALRVLTHNAGRHASDIHCPVLFCVCEGDTVVPARTTRRYARAASQGEVRLYPAGHFDIYVGELFEQVVADQLSFLERHVPPTDPVQPPKGKRT